MSVFFSGGQSDPKVVERFAVIVAVRDGLYLDANQEASATLPRMTADALKRAFSRLYGNQFSQGKFSLQQNSEPTVGYVPHDAESVAQRARARLPIDSDAQIGGDAAVPSLFRFLKVT